MCVLALAWKAHPHWDLVLIANRDEFFARPAASAARWDEAPHIIAGRDLQASGTWLGASERGRLAGVTNFREGEPMGGERSRGDIPVEFLGASDTALSKAEEFAREGDKFGPFSAILIDSRGAAFASNRPTKHAVVLEPGLHHLSNGPLNADWPKSVGLKRALEVWLATDGAEGLDPLFTALASREGAPPGHCSIAEAAIDRERYLAPAFVSLSDYGTRCSTIVTIDRAGRGRFIERTFGASGRAYSEVDHAFSWSG